MYRKFLPNTMYSRTFLCRMDKGKAKTMELTPEQQETLDKKKLPLQIADRLRLIFFFRIICGIIFIFWNEILGRSRLVYCSPGEII